MTEQAIYILIAAFLTPVILLGLISILYRFYCKRIYAPGSVCDHSSELFHELIGVIIKLSLFLVIISATVMKISNTEVIDSWNETETIESHEIVALKTDQDSETKQNGSMGGVFPVFAMYSSTTTQNDTYVVLYKTETGGFKNYSFPVDKTEIFEVEDNFHIEKLKEINVEIVKNKFFAPGVEQFTYPTSNFYKPEFYRLYIPKGSLVMDSYDAGWNG